MDSIIFDVDGTLWNSTGIVAKAWENYLRNVEQIELPLTAEIIASMFGQPLPDIAKQIFPDASREEQLRLIDRCCNAEHEALLKECAPLYEDLEKALQLLAEKYPLYFLKPPASANISKVICAMVITISIRVPTSPSSPELMI